MCIIACLLNCGIVQNHVVENVIKSWLPSPVNHFLFFQFQTIKDFNKFATSDEPPLLTGEKICGSGKYFI